jgi:hypothetical protein
MATKPEKFVMEGIEYDIVPSKFNQLIQDGYGVTTDSIPVFGGRNVIVGHTGHPGAGTYEYLRRIRRQGWEAAWDFEDSAASLELRNHLFRLYTTQAGFWVQLDDEMSREWARLNIGSNATFNTDDDVPFFTPTYPIFPFGYEEGDAITWPNSDLYVANKKWTAGYSVDQETGLVLVTPDSRQFDYRTKVHFRYTWRAYVRISYMSMRPVEINRYVYTGTVLFEQLEFPA